MDVLLVDPPYKSLKGVGTECAYTAGTVALAAYLRAGGVDCAVLTGDLLVDLPPGSLLNLDMKAYAQGQETYMGAVEDDDHAVWQCLADAVQEHKPKAVGIVYLTPTRHSVERVAAVVKKVDPAIRVIAGGHHATFCPEDALQNPNIDLAVRGEGEIPLLQIARALRDGSPGWSAVPGVSYRDAGGRVVHTDQPELIADLDDLPFPARDLVLGCDYDGHPVHYMVTARGCPYACSFCSDRRLWLGKVRRRSLDNVFEELRQLVGRHTVRSVDFVDGTFTYDRDYLCAFCERIAAEHPGLRWRCTARYDNLDEELLGLMREAGCSALYFGLESGSVRILESVNKRLTLEDVVRVSALVRKYGIVSIVSVLLGLPDETTEDIRETLEMMRALAADIFDVNCYVPLPGTPLYDGMDEEERRAVDWRRLAYKSLGTHATKAVGPEELEELVLEAHEIADQARNGFLARMTAAQRDGRSS